MWSNTRRDSGAYRWGAWRRLPKGLRRHDRRFRPGWARCRQQTMAPDAGRKAAFTRHAGIGADDSILADAGALNLQETKPALKASAQSFAPSPAPLPCANTARGSTRHRAIDRSDHDNAGCTGRPIDPAH